MDKELIEELRQECMELTRQGRTQEAVVKFNEIWELQFGDHSKPKIRPEIMAFASAMEAEMAKHDIDGEDVSWVGKGTVYPQSLTSNWSIQDCLDEIGDHWWTLRDASRNNNKEAISHKAIDIANYAMMIWYKAKGE